MTDGFYFETDSPYCVSSFEKALTKIDARTLSKYDVVYLIGSHQDDIYLAWFNGKSLNSYSFEDLMWELYPEHRYVYTRFGELYAVYAMIHTPDACPIIFNGRRINTTYRDGSPDLLISFSMERIDEVKVGNFISNESKVTRFRRVDRITPTSKSTRLEFKLRFNDWTYNVSDLCCIVKLNQLGG